MHLLPILSKIPCNVLASLGGHKGGKSLYIYLCYFEVMWYVKYPKNLFAKDTLGMLLISRREINTWNLLAELVVKPKHKTGLRQA